MQPLDIACVEEMHALGDALARVAFPGCVVALEGSLGAGKTELVRGMARRLCPSALVQSPTYAIIHEYEGALPMYHMDLYRLTPDAAMALGLEDYFYGDGLCVVEWANVAPHALPEHRLNLRIDRVGEHMRRVQLDAVGDAYDELLRKLEALL